MEEYRFFQNKFKEFSPESAETILDASMEKLSEAYKQSMKCSILALMNQLESNLEKELDWRDTSIYTGTTGYTLLYLHLAEIFGEEKYMHRAKVIAESSLRHLHGRHVSFLLGDAGPLALAAIIYDKLDQPNDLHFCISNLIKLKQAVLDIESGLPDELLYGRVGYLYALLVVKHKVKSVTIDSELIRTVILAVIESGKCYAKQNKSPSPLMYEWHGKKYLGAAHGLVGILVILLQMRERMTTFEMDDWVRPTIDYVGTLLYPSGNLPSSLGSQSDRLVHWCHGAPGAVFLFALSYKTFGEQKYLQWAKGCADVIWNRGLLCKGYGLCHGTAGNAYGLLYMYQITQDRQYLYKAAQFGRWCQDYGRHGCRVPDRPLSLFEGLAGALYFMADLLNAEQAKFPAYIL